MRATLSERTGDLCYNSISDLSYVYMFTTWDLCLFYHHGQH